MYRVGRNNFYKNEKKATVYTPDFVSNFLYSVLKHNIDKDGCVFDPSVGKGSLLKPFEENGFKVRGFDVEEQGWRGTEVKNYLEVVREDFEDVPSLVIMNPPFNVDVKTKESVKNFCGGRPLLSEVWLRKTVELFGVGVAIVLFAPYGLRLNQSMGSKRWRMFGEGCYPEIKCIISLPKDVFDGQAGF